MGEKLLIGPINKGLVNNRTAFNIDNDAFPKLINAYQWRGRVKRKRGTSLLGRLNRYIGATDGAGNAAITIAPGNISSGISQFVVDTTTYTDPGGASPVTLLVSGTGTASLNRTTGVLTITGGPANQSVYYYPGLPVMGLEDFVVNTSNYANTIAFDTIYAYNIGVASPFTINGIGFYDNPASTTYNGQAYTQKSTWTPTSWNGQNYQQFWTTNYQGTLWATNGIRSADNLTSIGMQFKSITGVAIGAAGPPASVTLTINAHGLVVGDWIFINEVSGNTGINFQTGYVTAVPGANSVTVGLPYATIGGAYTSGGIAQYLTSRSDTTVDCLRWYNGDPTAGTGIAQTYGKGWVNFAPPLFSGPPSFGIDDLPPAQYYLVGARMIVPFKDRLLFFGPVVQTSSASSQQYLQDTVIYSQNGTPYYTASFTGSVTSSSTVFNPLLVPSNQTATPNSYFEDVTGFGGYISSGVDQPIMTVSSNEDVLIVGFSTIQTRFVYTGNDLVPFNFFIINSELGSTSTFSAFNLDKGVVSKGSRGYIITSQTGAQRIDLEIPDEVFRVNLSSNGAERVCSQRDFINEWAYFTYRSNDSDAAIQPFNTESLLYNYRDGSWGLFKECYTTYGLFRKSTSRTWATIGSTYPTWQSWNDPWDAGDSTVLNPEVVAGNQQGFVLIREGDTTAEGNSLFIQNISGNTITSPNHCLSVGDFIVLSGMTGSTNLNGAIVKVNSITLNTFTFSGTAATGTYTGKGLIKRAYVPSIQTKQFPTAWDMARKTRIGPQQYLLTKTPSSQITILIYLSQDSANAYNDGLIVPDPNSQNSSLIYSTILYTCPESTNLGLTAANTNLQMIAYPETGTSGQEQIWHRMNTSLIGDTVQIGFTISDSQMQQTFSNGEPLNAFAEVELHSIILDVQPSQVLA